MYLVNIILVCCIAIHQIASNEITMENLKLHFNFDGICDMAKSLIDFGLREVSNIDRKTLIEIYRTEAQMAVKFLRDGNMTISDYMALISSASPQAKFVLEGRYNEYDVDHDGVIESRDINSYSDKYYYFDLLKLGADTNNDFSISRDEFHQFVSNAEFIKTQENKDSVLEVFGNFDQDKNQALDVNDIIFVCR